MYMPTTNPATPPAIVRIVAALVSRNNIHDAAAPNEKQMTAARRHGPDGIFGRFRSHG